MKLNVAVIKLMNEMNLNLMNRSRGASKLGGAIYKEGESSIKGSKASSSTFAKNNWQVKR